MRISTHILPRTEATAEGLQALGIEQINLAAHDPQTLQLIGEHVIPAVS